MQNFSESVSEPKSAIDQTFVVGPFQCNCRLIVCPITGHALVIDPGDEPALLIREIEKTRTSSGLDIQVKLLFQTHGHLDHVGASKGLKQKYNAPIAIHKSDEPLYNMLKSQGQLFGLKYEDPLPIDRFIADEEQIQIGSLKFSVLHTPGHSPGSVCLRWHEDRALGVQETLFSGDTLFQGSVGRTDLWGADHDQMFQSIRERILVLDSDTRVCPGHGSETLIGVEKRSNPFLV